MQPLSSTCRRAMKIEGIELEKINDYTWEIPRTGKMVVPGVVFSTRSMLQDIVKDDSLRQVMNVAHLPGIEKYSIAMPDIHRGYGFPIGGVAAMDMEKGVISPGGVGYDINCGCRLLRSNLEFEDIEREIDKLGAALFTNIPSGVGSTGKIKLSRNEERDVLIQGARWVVKRGFGSEEDLEKTEDRGTFAGADPDVVSEKAMKRGKNQLGTLGSGNHFLEIDIVDEIYDAEVADAFGLRKGQVVVQVHSGSRGFGYQVCDDFLGEMMGYMRKKGLDLPDRQLACAHINSPEGKKYLKALACAANYAWANRQVLSHWTRETFQQILRMGPAHLGMDLVYDCGHNIVKIEEHEVGGKQKRLLVHRKGSTRSLPAGRPELPPVYKDVGQPVLIPGDMGRCSYVLVGAENALTLSFGSTCHGAGRMMSRTSAKKQFGKRDIKGDLRKRGIRVFVSGKTTLMEEISEAYKDVSEVVEVVHRLGIAAKVAKLRPVLVVKG